MIQSTSCDRERLRLLAEDKLSASDLCQLELHVQYCQHCQAELEMLAATDRWFDAARKYLGEEDRQGDFRTLADLSLDFLTPSDWPDSLGRIGLYEIKGVIGRGGMGVVLKAVDPVLNRTVAIKVLAGHLAASGVARQRFLREARAAAAVVHEHVVAVHAVAEANGLPYLVMEYVPGGSLQDRLDREGPLPIAAVLRIGMQAAAGLAIAHNHGLVHRDVKPANILLDVGVERSRLTDFGLARAGSDANLTQSGVVSGTPHYMSPEQARGDSVDHRADLFSLGSTIYAMCAGYPPFRAESAVAILRRVSDDTPRPLHEVNSNVPDWLETIIARLHAKDPDDRYQSASEVADLMSKCLAYMQQPSTLMLPVALISKPMRSRRWKRGLQWIAAIAAVACLATTAILKWPNQQETEAAVSNGGGVELQNSAESTSNPVQLPRIQNADEIEHQMHLIRQRECAIEAELKGGLDSNWRDPISEHIQNAFREAQRLEQEIRSNAAGASANATGASR